MVLTGDLHNDCENVGLSLRGMLETVTRDTGAALTQGQLCLQEMFDEIDAIGTFSLQSLLS